MSDGPAIENPDDTDENGIATWAITNDYTFVLALDEYNPLPNEPANKVYVPFHQIKQMGQTGKGEEKRTFIRLTEGAQPDILVKGHPEEILSAVVDTSRQIAELIATAEEMQGYDKSGE